MCSLPRRTTNLFGTVCFERLPLGVEANTPCIRLASRTRRARQCQCTLPNQAPRRTCSTPPETSITHRSLDMAPPHFLPCMSLLMVAPSTSRNISLSRRLPHFTTCKCVSSHQLPWIRASREQQMKTVKGMSISRHGHRPWRHILFYHARPLSPPPPTLPMIPVQAPAPMDVDVAAAAL